MNTFKCAAVQMESDILNLESNLNKMEAFIRKIKAEDNNIKLIIFPELCTSGYLLDKKTQNISEIFSDGNISKRLCKVANENDVDIIYGYVEKNTNNKPFNSLLFIDSNGKIKGNYQKTHLVKEERKIFSKGRSYSICKSDYGKIGMMICFDSAFPEVGRAYGKEGVDLMVICAAWEKPYEEQWEISVKSTAFNNATPVLASNSAYKTKNLDFFGQSMFVNEYGVLEKSLGKEENYIICEINKDKTKKSRKDFLTQLNDLKQYNLDSIEIKTY